ncbi:hypothetical protein G352_25502 [Rhodococcus ruber BKS 20-38]|uniref:Probable membrane transporter protein n=1 Tax=Rhodococcus ruber BKS 20-38 TaxID=1278076 RepID=M2Y9C1_9NOCA|nr:hypothetical protein G352_25502 [Rhodococcus ruber BKS 20-38]
MLSFNMRAAVGTSLLVIITNSLASLAARASTITALPWAIVLPFTAAAVSASWLGKRVGGNVSSTVLQRVFAGILLLVAAAMLADAAL